MFAVIQTASGKRSVSNMFKLRFTPSKILYGLLFTLIVFNGVFSNYISFFSYFDEAVVAVAIVYIAARLAGLHEPIKTEYVFITLSTVVILLIGFMGNAAWGYHESSMAILKDVIVVIKFPIVIIAMAIWKKIF